MAFRESSDHPQPDPGDAPATEVPVPRVLAALRPRMLELARDRADGAHPYFVPPSHTPLAPSPHPGCR